MYDRERQRSGWKPRTELRERYMEKSEERRIMATLFTAALVQKDPKGDADYAICSRAVKLADDLIEMLDQTDDG